MSFIQQRRSIFIGIALMCVIGSSLLTGYSIIQRMYTFTAKLPDAKTMNLSANMPFDDVGTRSLLSLTACVTNGLPPSDSLLTPYSDGQLVGVHIMPSTQIWDRRGRDTPARADATIFQSGQKIEVRIANYPSFADNAEAATIIVYADGTPEPCVPYSVKHMISQP